MSQQIKYELFPLAMPDCAANFNDKPLSNISFQHPLHGIFLCDLNKPIKGKRGCTDATVSTVDFALLDCTTNNISKK